MHDEALVGFAALWQRHGIQAVQPLAMVSRIGSTQQEREQGGFRSQTFPGRYRPARDDERGHFEFGLKYEDLNLEWLARFFGVHPPAWIERWVHEQPTSQYARRTAFLYEWLTGRRLDAPDTAAGNYVPVIAPERYLVRGVPARCRRWRVLDNLPGTPAFCPVVRLTQEVRQAVDFDLAAELAVLDARFGADLLARSAAWLTFNESRASFALERELDRPGDIQRFAAALAAHCGRLEAPLSAESLALLQREVLGARALRLGQRRSPVFVGSAAVFDATVVRYIGPHWRELDGLLAGLRALDAHTATAPAGLAATAHALLRAAALSFGFVYLHPMADGNGRIHRFLINDTLARAGLLPAGVVMPISSTIVKSSRFRGLYERVLDSISARQVRHYAGQWRFGADTVCDDGVVSNFEFDGWDDALALWRYPDLTAHATYLAQVVHHTVRHEMTDEATFLARHDLARRRLKSIVEMPDADADRIVRSLREGGGRVSNVLRRQYPTVFDDGPTETEVVEAVGLALQAKDAPLQLGAL